MERSERHEAHAKRRRGGAERAALEKRLHDRMRKDANKAAAHGMTMKPTMRNASEMLCRIPAPFELANWPAITGKITVAIAAATT